MTEKIKYSEAMAEVESILARLRSEQMSIDELSDAVRRASELIEECRKILTQSEQEVEKLLNRNEA
jgi:exodeoxyribonuclease VII small subunit